MKMKLIAGMAAVVTSVTLTVALAGPGAKPKLSLDTYQKQVRDHMEASSKANKTTLQATLAEHLIGKLNLGGSMTLRLRGVVKGENGSSHQDALVISSAAKELADQTRKENKKELADSYEEASKAIVAIVANSTFVGGKVKGMSEKDAKDASAALKKLEEIVDVLVTNFSSADRATYAKVINKYGEIMEKQRLAPEAALLQAIKEVQNADHEKAMEIIRKIIDCTK